MDDFNQTSENLQIPKPSPEFRMMVSKMTSNMSFVGLFTIIYGAITCLTIVGAIVGIPMIIAGLRLRESSDSFSSFKNSYNFESLRMALEQQNKFFFIYKVMIIIGLVLFTLYLIFFFTFFASMFSSFGGSDF